MSKHILLTILILNFSLFNSYSQAPQGYYSSAQGLTGFQLKTALKNIIDDIDDSSGLPFHTPQQYSDLWNAYANTNSGFVDNYTNFDNDGFLLDIYSENPNGIDPYNHSLLVDQCGNFNAEGVCYNREHLLPQSLFNQQLPMRSDFHSTFPTDGQVNGYRGNLPYGEVSNPNLTTLNGSKRGPNVFPGYNGNVFEPLDEFKGDIARALLYFAVRYEDEINTSGWADANDNILNSDSNQFYDDWYIDLLLSWHIIDPVSQEELDRNENGFNFQNNRNPFIDNPTYVQAIWDENFSADEFQSLKISVYPNPVRSQFLNIDSKGISNLKFEVYNIFGQPILKGITSESNHKISVQQWPSGVYIINLKYHNLNKTIKIILP
ncbi:endonuclease [Psychroflexus sp. MBR-150]|jgi:endonuclease I